MFLFICDPTIPCITHNPQTFILAQDQSLHPNKWHRSQPDPAVKSIFQKAIHYPEGECISILPCGYCLQQDPTVRSHWWRIPRIPQMEGAAKRPTALWKAQPLFQRDIIDRDEISGYVKETMGQPEVLEYHPFTGPPNASSPLVITLKRKSKGVSWADLVDRGDRPKS